MFKQQLIEKTTQMRVLEYIYKIEILASVIGDLTNVAALNKKNLDNIAAVRADVEA